MGAALKTHLELTLKLVQECLVVWGSAQEAIGNSDEANMSGCGLDYLVAKVLQESSLDS